MEWHSDLYLYFESFEGFTFIFVVFLLSCVGIFNLLARQTSLNRQFITKIFPHNLTIHITNLLPSNNGIQSTLVRTSGHLTCV